jgi:uncharacterized protein (TIGR00369 family)
MTQQGLELAQAVLKSQPFSVWLGAEITAFTPEHTELHLPIKDEFRQQNGLVHGGVLAYMVDNALTFAGGTVLGAQILTAEFKINYLRPAEGDRLIARGQVLHAGKRQAVCRCEVFTRTGQAETRVAAAQGTIARS